MNSCYSILAGCKFSSWKKDFHFLSTPFLGGLQRARRSVVNNTTLEEKIERFWTIEELQDVPKLTQEELDCEEHFRTTFSRDATGRYVVRLPKQMGFEQMIGESKETALRRFMQLERRFNKDPELRRRYNEEIRAYLDQNHMKLVPEQELKRNKRITFYLPHHPVFKELTSTTKIRPVFDGSSKTSSNYSLNDGLMTGLVDRYAFTDHPALTQFHVFSDASEAAYGACIYARCISRFGRITVELLAAKSRPASLKKITLARLELCGALVAARLYRMTVHALKMEEIEAWFWSDSTIVLSWLKLPPCVWPTFVANRVSHIQELTKGHRWNHVKGTGNPADLVSRGVMPKDLADLSHWFHAIGGIIADEAKRPRGSRLLPTSSFSGSLFVLLEAIADYSLFVNDLKEAKYALVRCVQLESFSVEIKALENHRIIPAHSSLKLLNPFLDQQGILRVCGRLKLAGESYSVRHPMIIPGNYSFSRQMAVAYHVLALHSGFRMTFTQIRQEFWPLNGRALTTFTFRNCIRCFRSNPVPISQPPGQFPRPRTSPTRAFAVTGVDYCGPVYLKPVHRRAAAQKAYIAVFVCFSTKAVHLELIGDLTTAAFLAALRRFVSHRDASNHLRELYDLLHDPKVAAKITSETSQRGIIWKFIPPRAPNFGGLWEAAVKSAKLSLIRVLGKRQLSFEDMATILTQVEAIMNARPLTPLSEDPDELDAPDPDYTDVATNRLQHYQQLQQLVQQHWKRWRREYISQLHNQNQRFPQVQS
ncbi:uncharacterized protein LOC129773664 [Toxorhynchites rutilus septentrionalis]|uniref:uncharacterized protein LOC129773664 n=1 Tax=Toxorhynchites rutilus septentrionalis TaxID=329112 RepID=UPI002479860C|nr:uncharacterized protein LOC129773664 [Toxorhynchites rutilus septentrionalis]